MTSGDADGSGDVRTIVFGAIAETAGVEAATVTSGLRLEADLRIDSLEFVRLIQLLEERLDLTLTDAQAAAVVTAGDLLAVAEAAVSQA